MKETDWDALLEEAAELIAQSESALGEGRATTVEWLGTDTDVIPHRAFRVDEKRKRIALNRDLVSEWLRNLPHEQAEDRFAGLVLRATAALHFSPPSLLWQEAVDTHVRSMEEQGLDASYGQAFLAARQILEGHRLDRLISDRVPGAPARLGELVRFELEALPTFDTYPRAAIIMSRPYLPENLTKPAFDEFIDSFGVDEAESLTSILSGYVSLAADAVEEMVEVTEQLVFRAFPEALGLTWDDDEDLTSDEVWPFKGTLPGLDDVDWDELAGFVATALARFTGEAGLDFGDALLIGVDTDPLVGRRIGAWSGSAEIRLDLTNAALDEGTIRELTGRGWEPFENAPESLHKTVDSHDAVDISAEVVWIIRVLATRTDSAGLVIWARGAAAVAARELGWEEGAAQFDTDELFVARPSDHEELARLARSCLSALTGSAPAEYEPGRFLVHIDDVDFVVLATEDTFPAIRLQHRVIDAAEGQRADLVDFANALHGRSSTMSSHWWLGDRSLWQRCEFWAGKFDQEVFDAQVLNFVAVARDRTPEIRARFAPRS